MKPINRYRITTTLFLGILGYVPLWGENLDFTPDRPDGPAKIQSALWELAILGAAKPARNVQDTRARTGNVQVATANGRTSARLPWISGVSPQNPRTNNVVTLSGGNFGSSRGNSSVRIGSVAIPSSSFTSWSNSTIRFRIPLNTPPGNLTVRTSQGTSNAIRLAIRSPYLTRISPTRVETGNRLTLTGGNFGNTRGTGYVLFTSIRPSAADYVSWSNSRIVVKVPARVQSGDVRVTTSNGTSGTKRIEIGSESQSPQITSISPGRVRYNQVVTIYGRFFGTNRGTSRVIFQGGIGT